MGVAAMAMYFILLLAGCAPEREQRVLIFSGTQAYRHQSIEGARQAVAQLCRQNGIQADTTENAAYFHTDSLHRYSAVIFLNSSGNALDHRQQAHFERYIQAGGGFVGIHGAATTEYQWPWFGRLVGAWFQDHPEPQQATVLVHETEHPATRGLPAQWQRHDEWYNFKFIHPGIQVLASLDEQTYAGGKHGEDHPIVWYHYYDGGRSFYTGLGHSADAYTDDAFLQHLLGGIRFAIGDNTLSYEKAYTPLVPEESRFVKRVLGNNLNEPMELEVFRDGKVLFIERKGAVKLYNPASAQISQIAQLSVHTKFEDGLIGLAKDPQYEQNHWIYMYYSPAGDEWIQRLSRFVFIADSLLMDSEKVVLEVPVQRATCCHTGGSIEFGPGGLLYLSTGDDTSPFNTTELQYNSDGYGPMNEMPGWSTYDAQKSSANTNDLRGKILRIKPEPDGSYSIPEGNLFPPGTPDTKPEIFVMGCRNPYRISIDQKNGILYYGDVGPDAGEDTERGPRGYDEVNQVKQAGYFGWPYFIANNQAYHRYNYATGNIGPAFDPKNPLNDSPNNTGMRELPPAQPAMIYYPYAESPDFEGLGTGGRNAMAGPVYYRDLYPAVKNKLPAYYSGKFFFFDWMRDWIMAATFDDDNNLEKYEPFLPTFTFSNIVDVTIAPDGTMYLLEYGTNWFSQNMDATLSQIDYAEGNRQPVAKLAADKLVGAAPLTVQFSGAQSYDFDAGDALSYSWSFGDSDEEMEGDQVEYVFEKAGIYTAQLTVTDASGDEDTESVEVRVGNAVPQIDIEIDGNHTFYWDDESIKYAVMVSDGEDGDFPGRIEEEAISFSIDYMGLGQDEAGAAMGHQKKSDLLDGAALIEEHNCFACHKVEEKSIGPMYIQVAERYPESDETIQMLASKIITGGNGNWGEQNMSAHPQLTSDEATAMVNYILSLNDVHSTPSMPLRGAYQPSDHLETGTQGYYIFMASYTDRGGEVVGPLKNTITKRLRHPLLEAESYDSISNARRRRPAGTNVDIVVSQGIEGSYIVYNEIDLERISAVEIRCGATHGHGQFSIELRQEAVDGPVVASATMPQVKAVNLEQIRIPLTGITTGKRPLYIVFRYTGAEENVSGNVDYLKFEKGGGKAVEM